MIGTYTPGQMDGPGPGPSPRASAFDGPLADATAAVGANANALRAARQRYRDAYQAEQARWRELRNELDEIELRGAGMRDRLGIRDQAALPDRPSVPVGPGPAGSHTAPEGHARTDRQVVTGAPDGYLSAGLPDGFVAPDEEALRLRDLRMRLELAEGDLGRHRAELARLDLAVDNLETTWLFLARDDGSLVMDPSSPASAAALQMRIIEAQEAERSRLAQEIHDGPAQALTNAIFQVQYVDRLLDQDPVVAGVELRYLGELLRRELSDVRSYISQLRPPLLDQLGLEGAIRDTVEHIAALSELQIRCDLGASGEHLGEAQQTVVLRIAQEALQNVRKHAKATHASVVTWLEPDAWVIEIRDDGRGFDPGTVGPRGRRNFGLHFMRERAGLIGARFEVRSVPDGGTTVRLTIPASAKESR
jgi:two-component system sensor histidine kinase DegS